MTLQIMQIKRIIPVLKEKRSHFNLKISVNGGTKIRPGIPNN